MEDVENREDGGRRGILMVVGILVVVVLAIVMFASMSGDREGDGFFASGNGGGGSGQSNSGGGGGGNAAYDTSRMRDVTPIALAEATMGETVVVYLGMESCPFCRQFVPILNDAIDQYGFTVLHVDLGAGITAAGQAAIMNLEEAPGMVGFMEENFGPVPLTLVMRDGVILGGRLGLLRMEQLVGFLGEFGLTE